MAKLTPDPTYGLISNYGKLMEYLNNCVPLQNLVEMFNNDRNTFNVFLTCPVSVQTYPQSGESAFEKKFGINKAVSFDLNSKGIWPYPKLKGDVDTVKVFSLDDNDDIGRANLVEASCIELCYYTDPYAKEYRSKVTASTLLALGINTVVVTNSHVMFGVKQ